MNHSGQGGFKMQRPHRRVRCTDFLCKFCGLAAWWTCSVPPCLCQSLCRLLVHFGFSVLQWRVSGEATSLPAAFQCLSMLPTSCFHWFTDPGLAFTWRTALWPGLGLGLIRALAIERGSQVFGLPGWSCWIFGCLMPNTKQWQNILLATSCLFFAHFLFVQLYSYPQRALLYSMFRRSWSRWLEWLFLSRSAKAQLSHYLSVYTVVFFSVFVPSQIRSSCHLSLPPHLFMLHICLRTSVFICSPHFSFSAVGFEQIHVLSQSTGLL